MKASHTSTFKVALEGEAGGVLLERWKCLELDVVGAHGEGAKCQRIVHLTKGF